MNSRQTTQQLNDQNNSESPDYKTRIVVMTKIVNYEVPIKAGSDREAMFIAEDMSEEKLDAEYVSGGEITVDYVDHSNP